MTKPLNSQRVRALAPENDPLKIGMGWTIEDLERPQIMVESTFGDSHPGSAHLMDLALVMPRGVAAMELVECMRGVAPDIVRAIEVFDVYHGDGIEAGKKSLAFRILMQDTRRTLEDSEVDTAVAALVAEAERSFDARLRG